MSIWERKYGPREGLEGPFELATGFVYYYDPKEGLYYNPSFDWYISNEEWTVIQAEEAKELERIYEKKC